MIPLSLGLSLALLVPAAPAADLALDSASLPPLPPTPSGMTTDWLLDATTFSAGVYRTEQPKEIALDNGLVRRTFRLAPNGATVGLDNLVTDATVLRAVRPEAVVTIDGIRYDVGGLTGQPNHAFLLPEWLDQMEANPDAFQLSGFTVGKPEARFAWKRVRHHSPDVSWPPKGVLIRFDYALPEITDEQLESFATGGIATAEKKVEPGAVAVTAPPSDVGRELLLSDDFTKHDSAWSFHTSQADERSSFENEGKLGEIYTPSNTAVYAERALPRGTRLVEATIDVGTDRSASWGPGLALVFEKRTVKFHIRPGGGGDDGAPRFGAFDGRQALDRVGGRTALDVSKPWTLRLRVTDSSVFCDARLMGGTWKTYHVCRFDEALSDPKAVRVGKLDINGGGSDFDTPGQLVRLRVLDFAACSGIDREKLGQLAERLKERRKVRVSVHYELYDGVPLMSKWLTVHNAGNEPITVDRLTAETLAVVEHSNWVEAREGVPLPRPDSLHVETDFAFGAFQPTTSSRHVVHWRTDPDYSTQVNYLRMTPCLLVVEPTYGPAQDVGPGETFESFRTFELIFDSTDRDRRGLAMKRMYRTIAPWVTENPLMMHMRTAKPEAVRGAIDQCAEVGFEMLILSFGSGFNIENESPEYLAMWKEVAEYARSKGIEIGGYSLLASRGVGGGNDVVSPEGESPTFGNCPALASPWGQDYFRKLYQFYEKTGFMLLEHDGSYPGDVDVTARPPLQKGEQDSRWVQWRIITDFYKWCRARGVFLNVPDYYYLSGSNKCGMGYREVNWSLPREHQVLHTRQNIYDGTWTKTPSMGWMFVPLTQYHGGGAAATVEPLSEHLDHYERMMASNLGAGVQACYRGPRLYDTDQTKAAVKKWVEWYKRYRDILESDIVHSSSRRADGRHLDWLMHANPKLEQKGMLVVFNPLDRVVDREIPINLYYTGRTGTARVREKENASSTLQLDPHGRSQLNVKLPPRGATWFVFE